MKTVRGILMGALVLLAVGVAGCCCYDPCGYYYGPYYYSGPYYGHYYGPCY